MKYIIWTIGVLISAVAGAAFASLLGWWGIIPAIACSVWCAGGNVLLSLIVDGDL